MNNRLARVGVAVTAWFLVSTPTMGQKIEKYAAPYPRDGVIKLGESDRVVAWEVLRPKGGVSPMYELPLDQVLVTLTEGAVKFTAPDGASRITQEKFGAVRYETKGTIEQEEGLNDIASRAIVFQLKDGPARTLPIMKGIPGQFPRLNTVKLFETDRINVWDQVWLPNQTLTNHLHYTQTVGVFLVGGKLLTRDLGKPSGAPFERHQGELLGVPPPRDDVAASGSGVSERGGIGNSRGPASTDGTAVANANGPSAAGAGVTRGGGATMVPHEEEWAGGSPRAIWIEFK